MNLASLQYRALRFLISRGMLTYTGGTGLASDQVNAIRKTAFTWLENVNLDIPALTEEFLRRVPDEGYDKGSSIAEYLNSHEMKGLVRSQAVTATGDCLLSSFARQPILTNLAVDYLGLPANRIMYHVSLDCLFRDNPGLTRPDGFDGAINFHRDVDAWRWLKVFVYLTDVEEGDGQHEIYLGSHLNFPAELRKIRRYEPSELDVHWECFKVLGKAGTCFAENTLAFHRGTLPTKRSRLALTAVYLDDSVSGIHPGMHFLG